jgi:chemotaxis protein MotA
MKKPSDTMSLIGLIAVFGMVVYGILGSGGAFGQFINIPSLVIVVGGGLTSLILAQSSSAIANLKTGFGIAFKKNDVNYSTMISEFVRLGSLVRKSGFLILEEEIENIQDPFLANGLQMLTDGEESEAIVQTLELRIDMMAERHGGVAATYDLYTAYLPAFGMIGTLIGLIIMLSDLSDSAALGSGMAAALITTFYGSLFANGVTDPIGKKVAAMSDEEVLYREFIIKGILLIQSGENPRNIEDKLLSYLSPSQMEKFKEENN